MTTDGDRNFDHDVESVLTLIEDAVRSNNQLYLAQLIHKLLTEYTDIATIVTENKYKKTWTHQNVLNFITYGDAK